MEIKQAEKADLKEILALQYLAYQSEAKLFSNPDIPPLRQTLDDVLEEYRNGVILKVTDSNNKIRTSRLSQRQRQATPLRKLRKKPLMRKSR